MDISVAHRLSNRDPRKQGNGKLDVIVKYCRHDKKLDLLNACRKKNPEHTIKKKPKIHIRTVY